MNSNLNYSLSINSDKDRNSWDLPYDKAKNIYKILEEEFKDYTYVRSTDIPTTDTVQMTINTSYSGKVPSGAMASFVPETWFKKEVYEKLLDRVEKEI
jgi:hypothetical protein